MAAFWSIDLLGAVATSPVSDGDRVFIALKSAHLTARAVSDGHELWRITKDVSVPMAAAGGLLFVSAGEAIEAIRSSDGASAWVVPRVKTAAPLVTAGAWLIATTDTEVLAISTSDGRVAWRHLAGGVRLAPAIDAGRVYTGAEDGRMLALTLATGAMVWEQYLPGGVNSLAASAGRVYAGGGDKQFYCLDGSSGKVRWPRRVGSIPGGQIAIDDERVYFTALDNVVYALDRSNGNQRWTSAVRRRPLSGVALFGHIVFVPVVAPDLVMLYDADGRPSGTIALPGEIPRDIPPHIRETPAGVEVFAVTGGLSNEWQLTFIAPAGEAAIVPFSTLDTLPGLPFLTDPELQSIGRVLGALILSDPPLWPAAATDWPLVLRDPPLEPLTSLPGLQMRPLSPLLPIRRGA